MTLQVLNQTQQLN